MEAPAARPESAVEEAQRVGKAFRAAMSVGEQWAVIDGKWWRNWTRYSGFQGPNLPSLPSGGTRPPPIDNSALADPKFPELLRKTLVEDQDFFLVHSDVWDLLVSWYGGGPAFMRKVLAAGLRGRPRLELHAQLVTLVYADEHGKATAQTERRLLSRQNTLSALRNSVAFEDDDWEDVVLDGVNGDVGEARNGATSNAARNAQADGEEMIEGAPTSEMNGEDRTRALGSPNIRLWIKEESHEGAPANSGNSVDSAEGGERNEEGESKGQQRGSNDDDSWTLLTEEDMALSLDSLQLCDGHHFLVERKNREGQWPRAHARAWNDFRPHDTIDACDTVNAWLEAEVLEVKDNSILIHYIGWNNSWDEWVPRNSNRLAAHGTYSRVMSSQRRFRWDSSGDEEGTPEEKGLVGLVNLGNTCFMNSTLQCLSNTALLTEFFADDEYQRQINRNNPLGWKGLVAEEYGKLMKKMWSGKYRRVAPVTFKRTLGEFQPRFSGYQQQDSSELLQFLLDGLHEDLNLVLQKPVTEQIEFDGRPDLAVAADAWRTHLLRNESIVVDLFQGQLKSRLVCPMCDRLSIKFDPFMFLSVPLPCRTTKTQIVAFVFADASKPISKVAVSVEKEGTIASLKTALEAYLKVDSGSMVAVDVSYHRVYRVLGDKFPVGEVHSNDFVYVYELPQLLCVRPSSTQKQGTNDDAGLHKSLRRSAQFPPRMLDTGESRYDYNSGYSGSGGYKSGGGGTVGLGMMDMEAGDVVGLDGGEGEGEGSVEGQPSSKPEASSLQPAGAAPESSSSAGESIGEEKKAVPQPVYVVSVGHQKLTLNSNTYYYSKPFYIDPFGTPLLVAFEADDTVEQARAKIVAAVKPFIKSVQQAREERRRRQQRAREMPLYGGEGMREGEANGTSKEEAQEETNETSEEQEKEDENELPFTVHIVDSTYRNCPLCSYSGYPSYNYESCDGCPMTRVDRLQDPCTALRAQARKERAAQTAQQYRQQNRYVGEEADEQTHEQGEQPQEAADPQQEPEAQAEAEEKEKQHLQQNWRKCCSDKMCFVLRWKDADRYDDVGSWSTMAADPSVKQFEAEESAGRREVFDLSECLHRFTSEETLSAEDAVYCRGCKEHRQFTKKFDLWRLPECLIIHLKRFSYSRAWREKIDSFVDFPVEGLQLDEFVVNKDEHPAIYDLYAISNHYGGMGGGHYTAYVRNFLNGKWFEMDDSMVRPVSTDSIKTSAAYVLFYRRRRSDTDYAPPHQTASASNAAN